MLIRDISIKKGREWGTVGTELTLVDISLGVVGTLIHLVSNSVLGGSGTAAQACVGVLGDRLVSLLGSLSSGALDGLSDVANLVSIIHKQLEERAHFAAFLMVSILN